MRNSHRKQVQGAQHEQQSSSKSNRNQRIVGDIRYRSNGYQHHIRIGFAADLGNGFAASKVW